MWTISLKRTVLSLSEPSRGWQAGVGASLASVTEPVYVVALKSRAGAGGFPPGLFSPPDTRAPEDDHRDNLSLYPVEETHTLLAISSLLILILMVSLLVGMALICRSDLQTCLPVRDIFMT